MDEQEEVQQNMISNLPLLFANGYPTSLEKITESQLEKFIPFMVRCSLGHINFQEKTDCSEPEWWPEDFPFTIPFIKPKKFTGNWAQKMKEIIIICYQFHRSVFLLRFCNDLAAYEHASLRFINNYNSTTSLFERRSNKLLVTFRNENMSYDQPQRSRKCLMRQKSKSGNQGRTDVEQIMVEPAPFDIYLCDNCDAELYSKEAILEHEKTCNVDDDDDDVILCDTPEPGENSAQPNDSKRDTEDNELRNGFLLNFNLQCREDSKNGKVPCRNEPTGASKDTKDEKNGFMIIDRNKRMPRRNRAVHSLTRCPTIPLSSPAGQLLLRTTKTAMTPEYLTERLERLERFCFAPLLSKSHTKPKYFEKKHTFTNTHCTFKKPQDYSSHVYVFPRRQFSQRRRTEDFLFLNSSLIRRCRPISVRLKKITDNDVKNRRSIPNTKLNIKLTRDATRRSNWKISSPSTEIIVDTIDLCSSDEEENRNGGSSDKKTHAVVQRRTDPGTTGIEMIRKAITTLSNSPTTTAGAAAAASIGATTANSGLAKGSLTVCAGGKKISLNTAEVSIIPIRKSTRSNGPAKGPDKPQIRSATTTAAASLVNRMTSSSATSVSVSASSTARPAVTVATITDTESSKSSTFDINALLTPTAALFAAPDHGITLPKPLQPSVYIFSNYAANALTSAVPTTNNEITTAPIAAVGGNTSFRNQNQENHAQNGTINTTSGLVVKHQIANSNVTPTITPDWYPELNALATNTNTNLSNTTTKQAHLVDRERARSLSLVSPSRVISIDLTS
ncbi:PREDICTED: uncharacterized protein LOC108362168 [Rhagoletis zephyria]|uniref:uncharacterized protein LOC108362168 n=1 Tax=Rhagoletis zephyria TaxID=28612 RepID=UPI0008114A61|nr:PREDICTED: uncharacterized protein LOC108362168 [Rhagoletis zephyria]